MFVYNRIDQNREKTVSMCTDLIYSVFKRVIPGYIHILCFRDWTCNFGGKQKKHFYAQIIVGYVCTDL